MPAELVALIDKPWLLALVLAVGAACGIFVERLAEGQKRAERRAYWQGRNAKPGGGARKDFAAVPLKGTPERAKRDAAEQLRQVMEADFTPRALLNRPEAQVFKALDTAVIARNPGWQVMAQVSLGEFLASTDKDAFSAVNSKRVDFALMDPDCRVRHALEPASLCLHLICGNLLKNSGLSGQFSRRRAPIAPPAASTPPAPYAPRPPRDTRSPPCAALPSSPHPSRRRVFFEDFF